MGDGESVGSATADAARGAAADDGPGPRPVLRHRDWMSLATDEYERLLALFATLSGEEWSAPTDCSEWDVRAVLAHLAGAARSTASMRETMRQARLGKRLRPDAPMVDGMNAVQVDERAERSPQELIAELRDAGARGVRARGRLPRPLLALPVPFGPPLGTRPFGYLMGRIYTRDAWLHRIDVCRATGRQPLLTAEHDGRIVADVAEEWARAHGRPFTLHLCGPAGGTWSQGSGGQRIELDAVEFCRVLSGRATGTGLLATPVPF